MSNNLDALLARNALVVGRRKRRPWVNAEHTLVAEITSERGTLSAHKNWEHSYYLEQLRNLVRHCREGLPSGDAS